MFEFSVLCEISNVMAKYLADFRVDVERGRVFSIMVSHTEQCVSKTTLLDVF